MKNGRQKKLRLVKAEKQGVRWEKSQKTEEWKNYERIGNNSERPRSWSIRKSLIERGVSGAMLFSVARQTKQTNTILASTLFLAQAQ